MNKGQSDEYALNFDEEEGTEPKPNPLKAMSLQFIADSISSEPEEPPKPKLAILKVLNTTEESTQKQLEQMGFSTEEIDFLKRRDVEVIEVEKPISQETFKILSFSHSQQVPHNLPQGYVYSGGVARNTYLLERNEHVMPPRDIDIVAIQEFKPDLSLRQRLSQKYMPDDYKFGYGVGTSDVFEYFTTKDFVLNQMFVTQSRVYGTPEALGDLNDKIIRPAFSKKDILYDPKDHEIPIGIKPKHVLKALRLALEFEELYGFGQVAGIEEWQYQTEEIPYFLIALQLNKAMQRGDILAQKFYEKLLQKGTVVHSQSLKEGTLVADSPDDLALELKWHLREEDEDENEDHNPFNFIKDYLNKDPELADFILRKYHLTPEQQYEVFEDMAKDWETRVKGVKGRVHSKTSKGKNAHDNNIPENVNPSEYTYGEWNDPNNSKSAMEQRYEEAIKKRNEPI